MANASEKKRADVASKTTSMYVNILIGLYASFVLIRVIWFWSSFSWLHWIGFIIMSAINYGCLSMIFQSLELGTPYTTTQDVLFINWFVMGFSIITEYAWYFYLVIPAYALYQYGGMLKNWIFERPAPEAPLSAADQKRMAKKERQSNRVKYVRG